MQMGLDTKRAEMAKLEERARQRGAALAQASNPAAALQGPLTGVARSRPDHGTRAGK